jgi:hypothetical protein
LRNPLSKAFDCSVEIQVSPQASTFWTTPKALHSWDVLFENRTLVPPFTSSTCGVSWTELHQLGILLYIFLTGKQ